MDPPGGRFDEEQHLQPPQPDRVDREEVAGEDAGSLLAQERPPSGRRRAHPMTAQRGADRGCRDAHTEPEQLALLHLL